MNCSSENSITTDKSDESLPSNGDKREHESLSDDLDSLSSSENLDEDIGLDADEQAQFREDVDIVDKKMSILCCGPTGSGKSTLLNGLMGEQKWTYSPDRFNVGDSLQRGTAGVDEQTFTKNNVKITVWDTPGLEGGANDQRYLQEIKEKCAHFDLFLYCIKITETRATDLFDEKSSLTKFSELFGVKKLWKHAVVVLTHANCLLADIREDLEQESGEDVDQSIVERKFAERVHMWKKKIRRRLKDLGFKKANKVPVIPSGIAAKPHLPGYPHWFSKVFEKVVDRMKYEARLAYLQLCNERMVQEGEVDQESIGTKEIHEQPFVISLKFKIAAGLASTGVGAISTLTGAGIGATIGALAIGIPTFGVFAGGGLVLGAAIGAGIGLGTSVATALAIKYFKKRKHRKKKAEASTL